MRTEAMVGEEANDGLLPKSVCLVHERKFATRKGLYDDWRWCCRVGAGHSQRKRGGATKTVLRWHC